MAYPILLNSTHKYLIAPGYIKHLVDGKASDLTMRIVAPTDVWIKLGVSDFQGQLDSFGIPRSVVDVNTGYVLNPQENTLVKGGMWSWARESFANTIDILGKLG